MFYFVRMFISVWLGVIGVFVLLAAYEFHHEVDATYRHLRIRNERLQQIGLVVDTQIPDDYYDSRMEDVVFRYVVAGVFLVCSGAFLGIENQSKKTGEPGEERVYGPEEN